MKMFFTSNQRSMQMKMQQTSQYMVFSTFKETVLLLWSLNCKVRTLNDGSNNAVFGLAIEASRLRRSLPRVLNRMRTILYPLVLL